MVQEDASVEGNLDTMYYLENCVTGKLCNWKTVELKNWITGELKSTGQ